MAIVDIANFEQQVRSVEPGPSELPGDGRPPLPSSTAFKSFLLIVRRSVRPSYKTKVLMELLRDEENDEGEKELYLLARVARFKLETYLHSHADTYEM